MLGYLWRTYQDDWRSWHEGPSSRVMGWLIQIIIFMIILLPAALLIFCVLIALNIF